MHIDDSGMNAFPCQKCFRLQCLLYHQAAGNDRHIRTIRHLHAFPQFEMVVPKFLCHTLYFTASCPQITGARLIQDCSYCFSRLISITGNHHCHPRYRPHQADVFHTLMGSTVFSYRQSRMTADHLYIQPRIGHIISHLIVYASRSKHRKSMYKRRSTTCGKSCRHIHHIGFCNANIIKSIRIFCSEIFRHRTAL